MVGYWLPATYLAGFVGGVWTLLYKTFKPLYRVEAMEGTLKEIKEELKTMNARMDAGFKEVKDDMKIGFKEMDTRLRRVEFGTCVMGSAAFVAFALFLTKK